MAWGWGTGRERTHLGRFLDCKGISQKQIQRATGLGEATLTRICSDNEYNPSALTKRSVVKGLQDMGYDVEFADFGW